MSSPMVEFRDVSKWFGPLQVLRGIRATIHRGEVAVICGPSGSGKSTLLRTINALEPIQAGEIRIEGRPLPSDPAEVNRLRQEIGMVFQQFNLFPHMTALQNVMEGLVTVRRMPRDQAETVAREMLAKVGLAHRIDHRPSRLSGGEQQRVAIARAMAMRPKILLFDEPTSALDPELIGEVLQVMLEVAREGYTMVVVTHEMDFAREVADRILFMDKGELLLDTTPDRFFTRPDHPRAQEFLRRLLRRSG